MAEAVQIMSRTVSEPWQDAAMCLWTSGSFGNVTFETVLSALCEYLSWKAKFMFPDYTGKFFLASCRKWVGESCQHHLQSGTAQKVSVCMSFESSSWLIVDVFRGNMECLGPSYLNLTQEIPDVLYTLESKCIVVVVNSELVLWLGEGTWLRLGCQWRSGMTQKWDDVGRKWENIYCTLLYLLLVTS